MKIEKIICDRCGAEIPEKTYYNPEEKTYKLIDTTRAPNGFFLHSEPVDLCDVCQEKLKEWFENV